MVKEKICDRVSRDSQRTYATAQEVDLVSRLEPDPRQPLCTDLEATARETVDCQVPAYPHASREREFAALLGSGLGVEEEPQVVDSIIDRSALLLRRYMW